MNEQVTTLWACMLLGKIKAEEIILAAKERMRMEASVRWFPGYSYALSLLRTDKAYAIIGDHPKRSTGNPPGSRPAGAGRASLGAVTCWRAGLERRLAYQGSVEKAPHRTLKSLPTPTTYEASGRRTVQLSSYPRELIEPGPKKGRPNKLLQDKEKGRRSEHCGFALKNGRGGRI